MINPCCGCNLVLNISEQKALTFVFQLKRTMTIVLWFKMIAVLHHYAGNCAAHAFISDNGFQL